MKDAHPNLYGMYLVYALLSIALGLNFLILRPTFDPLSIPKWTMGVTFLGCGVLKLVFLLFVHSPTLLRLSMALSVAIMAFWAMVLTFEFFRLGQTSLQLPLTYIGLAALGYLLLVEPFINPVTAVPTADVIEKLKVNGNAT